MSEASTPTKLEAAIAVIMELESVTPYELAKIASAVVERKVAPQMLYTYAKKGYLPTFEKGTKTFVASADAIAWLEKYVATGGSTARRINDDILARIKSAN